MRSAPGCGASELGEGDVGVGVEGGLGAAVLKGPDRAGAALPGSSHRQVLDVSTVQGSYRFCASHTFHGPKSKRHIRTGRKP